jgi:hypothetical protein
LTPPKGCVFDVHLLLTAALAELFLSPYTPANCISCFYLLLLLAACLQLAQQLSEAEAAARTQLKQVEAQHAAELEELAAGHAARVELLRGELSADATTAKKAEAKLQVRH